MLQVKGKARLACFRIVEFVYCRGRQGTYLVDAEATEDALLGAPSSCDGPASWPAGDASPAAWLAAPGCASSSRTAFLDSFILPLGMICAAPMPCQHTAKASTPGNGALAVMMAASVHIHTLQDVKRVNTRAAFPHKSSGTQAARRSAVCAPPAP